MTTFQMSKDLLYFVTIKVARDTKVEAPVILLLLQLAGLLKQYLLHLAWLLSGR